MNFDVSFVSAALTITDEYSLNVVVTLTPELCDTPSVAPNPLDGFQIQLDLITHVLMCLSPVQRNTVYEQTYAKKYIAISNIIVGIKRMHKYAARIYVQLEFANIFANISL